MEEIKYIKGDALSPLGVDNKIIVHICNDIGGWGKGFVVAISNKLKKPENEYREWFKSGKNFKLGEVQLVQVEDTIWIANLIGQHKINKDENGNVPIRYEAVKEGLEKISLFAKENKCSIHMPRIGCGLAGGKWELMEPIISNVLSNNEIKVTVYDL